MAQKQKRNRKKAKRSFFLPIFVVSMFFILMGMIFLGVLSAKEIKKTSEKELPVLKISLLNTTLEEIHENEKNIAYGGNQVEIFDGENMVFYDGVEIRGRGNYSWGVDKKSYRLKFPKKVDLFGMGKKRKWALIGNFVDDSLMRNDLAYFMSDVLGGEYKMEGRFVELVIDDKDLGVYYLVKTMEVDKQAVDLRDFGGVLVEVDNVYCEAEEKWWIVRNEDCLTLKDVVNKDIADEAMELFVEDYNKFLKAVDLRDFAEAAKIVDMESFARYYLLSEFTANPDAYVTSWFLYRDGVSHRIHAGPVWDFDAAFGNKSWGNWEEGFYAPMTVMGRFEYTYKKFTSGEEATRFCPYDKSKKIHETVKISWVMCDMMEMLEFRELLAEVYMRDFRNKREVIISHIDEMADLIGAAAQKDAEKWGKGDFGEAVEYLKWWVGKRFDLFDEIVFGKMASEEI